LLAIIGFVLVVVVGLGKIGCGMKVAAVFGGRGAECKIVLEVRGVLGLRAAAPEGS
jgi:hypothetical protein